MDAQLLFKRQLLAPLCLFILFLLFVPQTVHAQSAQTPTPFFAISEADLEEAALLAEFELAKTAGITGMVVEYNSLPQLDRYLQAANNSDMQLLLFTDNPEADNAYVYYANEPAFALFEAPLLVTTLGNYQRSSVQYDGVLWSGTTQITELPENLTAAKQVVDEMLALRQRILRNDDIWTVLVSAESPTLEATIDGALAVSPDAVIVADWQGYSAELRAEIEAPRTSVDEFYAAANAATNRSSGPLEQIMLFGGLTFVMAIGGVIVAWRTRS